MSKPTRVVRLLHWRWWGPRDDEATACWLAAAALTYYLLTIGGTVRFVADTSAAQFELTA